jgi:oligopeptide transport system permease protein
MPCYTQPTMLKLLRQALLPLLQALLTLWLVFTLTFVLLRWLPGGPFTDPKVSPQVREQLNAQFLLNRPLLEQYTHALKQTTRGDLGISMASPDRQVVAMVTDAAATSIPLGLLALVLGAGLGVVAGVAAAWAKAAWVDALLSSLALLALSTPSFVWGGLLVSVFALTLNWLPAATLGSPAHWVLPVVALAASPFAFSCLLVRAAVRDTLGQPFILAKQTAGLPLNRIAWRHGLRVSLVPWVALLGPLAAGVLTGSFAVEFVFALPGLGQGFVTAINSRDYTLLMGITLFYATLLIAFNLLTDQCLLWLDPRRRASAK